MYGIKNAGKRAHDAHSNDRKGEDSTRKKQKTSGSASEVAKGKDSTCKKQNTSDAPKEDNSDDGYEEEDEYEYSQAYTCNMDRVYNCSLEAHDYYNRYEKSPMYGGKLKCFSWRLLTSKCTTLTATLEQFASQAAVQETVLKLDNCYCDGHTHYGLEKTPTMPLTAAALALFLKDRKYMIEDESELSKDTILERGYAVTRGCLNQWCDNYYHCDLVNDKNERDECLKRLQQAIRRDALDKLPVLCRKHDPPCCFKLSRGMEQDVTTMWAQAHGVKSFSTCDKELLGKWTLPMVRNMSQHVTLNGEKFPDLPIDYAQPRDLKVTFDELESGLTLREVIEKGKGK